MLDIKLLRLMEKNELNALDVINITDEQWEFIEDIINWRCFCMLLLLRLFYTG
jgi:hypothetical protein